MINANDCPGVACHIPGIIGSCTYHYIFLITSRPNAFAVCENSVPLSVT